jgi:adenylate kinase family enzyme
VQQPDQLCSDVHAQLAELCRTGVLHADSSRHTDQLYPLNDIARQIFQHDLVTKYLNGHDGPSEEGTAIITAGVPGAGKTTMVKTVMTEVEGEDLLSYRRLDADDLKVELIKKAVADGIYDDILAQMLDDGSGVAPMELAPLVHHESNKLLLKRALAECLERQENIIIEGTLTWDQQPGILYDQLAEAGYNRILVLGMEVERDVAHSQALSRWWNYRQAWRNGEHALGGRFTPPYSIDDGYDGGAQSKCTRNALSVLDRAHSGKIDTVEVKIFSPAESGGYDLVDEGCVRRAKGRDL